MIFNMMTGSKKIVNLYIFNTTLTYICVNIDISVFITMKKAAKFTQKEFYL